MLAAMALSFGFSCAACAQARAVSTEESFFKFFNKTCLLNMPRLDKVRAAARIMDWKSLTGDLATLLSPQNANARFEGWAVSETDLNYVVGVSEGAIGSSKVAICSASIRNIDQEALVKIIERDTKARLENDEIENLQRYRGWIGTTNGEAIILQLTTMANSQLSAATLAAIAETKN